MAMPLDLWPRCFRAAARRLAELDYDSVADSTLAGLASRIHEKQLPDLSNVIGPCLLLTMQGVSADFQISDTATDETALPVAVSLWGRQSAKDDSLLGAWLSLTLMIGGAFRARSMATYGVSECWRVDAASMTPLDAARALGPKYQDATGGLILKFRCFTDR
jgi:hypothetical protein